MTATLTLPCIDQIESRLADKHADEILNNMQDLHAILLLQKTHPIRERVQHALTLAIEAKPKQADPPMYAERLVGVPCGKGAYMWFVVPE